MNPPAVLSRDARGLPPIYLCGPIAGAGEAARGGYQACNRRTIEALRAAGADVRELPFPHPHARGLRKMVEYALGFLALYVKVLRCPPGAILHLTALSMHFIYLEWVIVQLARLRRCRVLFDLRAGAGLINYQERTALYRRTFDATARASRLCLVEGEELLPFLRTSSGRPTFHFPNHLDTSCLPARHDSPSPASPVIAYAGRIVPEKGIDILLAACRLLREHGVHPTVRIAGDGEPAYLQRLRLQHADLDVEWLGPLPSADVAELFCSAHFFLFPTRHFGEGQSNALTEALACGCVPVVSRHGFNPSVIGPVGAVLDLDAGPEQYAQQVLTIWRDQVRWAAESAGARTRAAELFSTSPVIERLLQHYRAAVL